jgi:tetratricopeptide (TPR) repeat protein
MLWTTKCCVAGSALVLLSSAAALSYRLVVEKYPVIELSTDIGTLHHPIATKSKDAQKFFDQGLTFIYAFDFPRAAASFRRAADLDPRSPMPYWGLALAYGPNYNVPETGARMSTAAREAIQIALNRSTHAPEIERAYISALARRYGVVSGMARIKLARDYADAMRDLYRRLPDDPDAATLYVASMMELNPWRLWTISGKPAENTLEIIDVLENTLRRWPDHVGANHYYVHATEGSPYPERALAAAHRLEGLVPGCSHLVHMPAHVYFRTGDYAAAVRISRKAIAVDEKQMSKRSITDERWPSSSISVGSMPHNLDFLIASAEMTGDFEDAFGGARQLVSDNQSQLYKTAPIFVLLRFAKWDQVLTTPMPNSSESEARLLWHFAQGCAYAMKRNVTAAQHEQVEMEREYSYVPSGPAFGTLANDWLKLHTIASDLLSARIEWARNNTLPALDYFQKAVVAEDNLEFDDLPDWYYPIRESLGAALLISHRFTAAEQVFRKDLVKTPLNPRSLYGLSKTLEAEGRVSEANSTRRLFDKVWKGASLRIEEF